MGSRASFRARGSVHGQLKLANLLTLSEEEFSSQVLALERDPIFERLLTSGAVSVEAFEGARFASRRFGGWGLRTSSDGLPEALDSGSAPVKLIEGIGQDRFEECFLRDSAMTDTARARASGISPAEAKLLRDFVDRLYIQEEFSAAPSENPAPRVFSAVAGVEIVNGEPALAFFNRPIWKGRYRVHADRYALLKDGLTPRESARIERLLRRLEFLDRRKTTLYRTLEEAVRAQADYLRTGDPGRRRALTQRELADRVDASPSTLNRLIANKSVQLPWGIEAPLRVFVPSSKTLLRDRLNDLATTMPGASDEALAGALERETGTRLSRRSIAQYRHDLGLGRRGRRH
ncbi:MAG: hypothetical protein KGJ84_13490 [Elusimicrobia bacterium]|nr:hypothetical protein [Elusimicrobiota bacterium]